MEDRSPTNGSMTVSGGNNSGNFSVGNNVNQVQDLATGPAVDQIYSITQKFRELLAEQGNVLNESGAQSALDELDETLADGEIRSRPPRLRSLLTKLRGAVGDAAASALPFAQLTVAIENLLHAKP